MERNVSGRKGCHVTPGAAGAKLRYMLNPTAANPPAPIRRRRSKVPRRLPHRPHTQAAAAATRSTAKAGTCMDAGRMDNR